MKCHICNKKLVQETKNAIVLNGFLDQDTKQYVHFACRQKHYHLKNQTKHKNLFSEYPAILQNIQLELL